MALIEINKNPSKRELAWFGLLFLIFFGIIGGLVYFSTRSLTVPGILWTAAGAVTVLYYLVPPIRLPLYLGWLYASYPIGWVISHVVLALVYYLVFTPIGLIMRLCGRDPMNRRLDKSAASYWTEHPMETDPARYFHQF